MDGPSTSDNWNAKCFLTPILGFLKFSCEDNDQVFLAPYWERSRNMRSIAKSLLAIGLLGLATASARADLLTSLLTLNGEVNTLKDNSVSAVTFGTGDTIGVGDIITGVAIITQRTAPTISGTIANPPNSLAILFSGQITSGPTPDGTNVDYKLSAVAPGTMGNGAYAGQDVSIKGLLSSFANAANPNNVFAVLESTTAPTNPTGETLKSFLTQANSGMYKLDIAGGIDNANDFFAAQLASSSLSTLAGLVPGTSVGKDVGGFTANFVEPGLALSAVPIQDLNLHPTKTFHDIAFSAFLSTALASEAANGYFVDDQSSYFLNAVAPEPSSMILLLLGSSGLGIGSYFRRRRSAA